MAGEAFWDRTGTSSGGSGALLAAEQVGKATTGSTAYGTTWANIVENSVTLEVSFTTGTSGVVVVSLSFDGTSANVPFFRLYDTSAAAVVAGTYKRGVYGTTDHGNYQEVRWLVSLTASTAYTLRPQTKANTSTYSLFSGPGSAELDYGPILCTVQEA